MFQHLGYKLGRFGIDAYLPCGRPSLGVRSVLPDGRDEAAKSKKRWEATTSRMNCTAHALLSRHNRSKPILRFAIERAYTSVPRERLPPGEFRQYRELLVLSLPILLAPLNFERPLHKLISLRQAYAS